MLRHLPNAISLIRLGLVAPQDVAKIEVAVGIDDHPAVEVVEGNAAQVGHQFALMPVDVHRLDRQGLPAGEVGLGELVQRAQPVQAYAALIAHPEPAVARRRDAETALKARLGGSQHQIDVRVDVRLHGPQVDTGGLDLR